MTRYRLPEPTPSALAHSQDMRHYINKKMQAMGGRLPFEQFMQDVLYAPGLGYYSAGSHKLGSAGDFITAPEISPLFAKTLAHAIAPYLQTHAEASVLELGPGGGKLAVDILLALSQLDAVPARYYLLEVSADLKQRQQAYLAERLPAELFARCRWLDTLPVRLDGIVLANEVLDALAVHVFRIEQEEPSELWLQLGPEDSWQPYFDRPSSAKLSERITALRERYDLPMGYQSELNLRQEGLLHSLAAMLGQGLLLFIDYGFSGTEFYHPERDTGTLQCHYRHHSHADPLWLPGLQDITSHIDFTALATCGINAGLGLALYSRQADFLVAAGLLELAAREGGDAITQSQALQKLLMPHEMGDLFKVMAFTKGEATVFEALALADLRHTL